MKTSLTTPYFWRHALVAWCVGIFLWIGWVEASAKPSQARRAPTVEREVRDLPELPRILPERARSEHHYMRARSESGVRIAETASPAAQSLQVVSSSGPALVPTQPMGAADFDLAAFQQQIRNLMNPAMTDEDYEDENATTPRGVRSAADTGLAGFLPPEFSMPQFRTQVQTAPAVPGAMAEMGQIEQPGGVRLFPHPAEQFGTRDRLLMYFPVVPVQNENERVFMVPLTIGGSQATPAGNVRPMRSTVRVTREP